MMLQESLNLLRSFKRRTPFQVAWKPAVTYYKLCSCYQQIAEQGGEAAPAEEAAAEETAETPAE